MIETFLFTFLTYIVKQKHATIFEIIRQEHAFLRWPKTKMNPWFYHNGFPWFNVLTIPSTIIDWWCLKVIMLSLTKYTVYHTFEVTTFCIKNLCEYAFALNSLQNVTVGWKIHALIKALPKRVKILNQVELKSLYFSCCLIYRFTLNVKSGREWQPSQRCLSKQTYSVGG